MTGTVLLVEHEGPVRTYLEQQLAHDGFEVLAADAGGTALDLAEEVKPDLVLLDAILPDASGFELCSRLRGRDYKIVQVPETMAMHDMAMLEFSQWWLRMVRGGYASWELYERTGLESSKARIDSARIWGAGWPSLVLLVSMGAFFVPWWLGLPAVFAALMIGPAQAVRIMLMARERGMAWADSWSYGWLMMAGKFAALRGQWLYMVDRENEQAVRLIEHKTPPPPAADKPTIAAAEKSSADKMASLLAPSPEAQRWNSYSGTSQWRG